MTTRFADHLPTGDHASRPAATALPDGSLYSCTDHGLIYQTDGATWSTWATLGGGAVDAGDVTFTPTGTIAATDVQAAIAEVASEASGGGLELLAYDFWNPATAAAPASTSLISGPTYTDVANIDSRAVNITFNAPASGDVLVTASALVDGNGQIAWALKESTTIVGVGQQVSAGSSSSRGFAEWPITGLTPASSHTYKLAHATSTGQCNIYAGGGSTNPCGPLVMKVWAI